MLTSALRFPLLAALAAFGLLTVGSEARAQTCDGGSGRYVLRVKPGVLAFPVPTPDDFAAGWIEHGPVEINVRPRGVAQRPWVLCIRAEGSSMGNGKPITDVQYRRSGESQWAPLTPGDQPVAEGDRGTRVSFDFRILLQWSDPAGAYRADYTITAARP